MTRSTLTTGARRALRDHRQARRRRDGRGVSGARSAAPPRCRAQDPARHRRGRSRSPRALHARGARRGGAQPPAHRHHLFRGRHRHDRLPDDGTGRRAFAGRRAAARRPAARACARDRDRRRGSHDSRSPERHHAPRPQAREHHARRRRAVRAHQSARLRPRENRCVGCARCDRCVRCGAVHECGRGDRGDHAAAHRRRAHPWHRWPTCHPSKPRGGRPTGGRICFPWASCSTRWPPGNGRSAATPACRFSRRSSRTRRDRSPTSTPRSRATWDVSSVAPSRRIPSAAIRARKICGTISRTSRPRSTRAN